MEKQIHEIPIIDTENKMQFSEHYFEDETRDGFYISGIMKRCWAAQLEVLSEVDKVCRKHGIAWFADCGTLLGAVRHGGFIPWDDDLDICMMRDDYDRFLSVARQELPDGYAVFDYHDEDFAELLIRISNTTAIRLDQAFGKRNHDFPYAAGIDIFPLDFVGPDPEEEETRRSVAMLAKSTAYIHDLCLPREKRSAETNQALSMIEEICHVRFHENRSLKEQLLDLTVALFSLYKREEAKEVVLTPYWIDEHNCATICKFTSHKTHDRIASTSWIKCYTLKFRNRCITRKKEIHLYTKLSQLFYNPVIV